MYEINNEAFGSFVASLRKEKGMTQKELAERVFVSDKTVSKWERGASMPNVALLLPLAEVLEVSVTELLRGERIPETGSLKAGEVEKLVVGSLDYSVGEKIGRERRGWKIAYGICFLLTVLEILWLLQLEVPIAILKDTVFLMAGLMLLFGGWFCFLAKELLPGYYDEHPISYYTQGIFKMHLPGLQLNNSNWPLICRVSKFWCLAGAVLYPLVCIGVLSMGGRRVWEFVGVFLALAVVTGLALHIYYIGKRYA